MKLLQVNIESNYGSTGRIAEGIGTLAKSQGFESHIAYSRGSNPSSLITHQIGSKVSQGLHLLKTRVLGEHLKGSGTATRQLIGLIQELNPDIIQIHQVHGYYLHVPKLFNFLKESGIKVVWTLHDCWSFTGHCSHYTRVNCYKWKTECHTCPQFKGYPKSYFFDRSRNEFRLKKDFFGSMKNLHLVAISDWLEGEVSKSMLSELPLSVIKNGVDMQIFKPIDLDREKEKKSKGITTEKVVIATGTTWNSSKGLEDYRELSTILPKNTTLLLVGIPSPLQTGFSDSTKFIERTESVDELVRLYNLADVVLSLSYQESFGLTIPEGLACGTPGVAYDNTALKEHLTEQTGMLVSTGNVKEASRAIALILNQGKTNMSEACVSFCHKNYNLESNFQNYISLYHHLLVK